MKKNDVQPTPRPVEKTSRSGLGRWMKGKYEDIRSKEASNAFAYYRDDDHDHISVFLCMWRNEGALCWSG